MWLPYLARALDAPPPRHLPVWLARLAAGEVAVSMMTQIRGSANDAAKRELGWQPPWASWREGFRYGLEPDRDVRTGTAAETETESRMDTSTCDGPPVVITTCGPFASCRNTKGPQFVIIRGTSVDSSRSQEGRR